MSPALASGLFTTEPLRKPFLIPFFFFLSFFAYPHGMWDLSSPTRDRTCAPCIGKAVFFFSPFGCAGSLWLLLGLF